MVHGNFWFKKQTKCLHKLINSEKVLFLGDGDGISILLALFSKNKPNNIKEICVLDIDERKLNLYKQLIMKNHVEERIKFSVLQYNVIDKIPSQYKNYFDYFYINPPYCYETTPAGLGFFFWLERCKEFTKENAEGYIVYPESHGKLDISNIKENIYNYLKTNNFDIVGTSRFAHKYHESQCLSKNLYVKKCDNCISKYCNKQIPKKYFLSMYLDNHNPPYLIKDDGSVYGSKIEFK